MNFRFILKIIQSRRVSNVTFFLTFIFVSYLLIYARGLDKKFITKVNNVQHSEIVNQKVVRNLSNYFRRYFTMDSTGTLPYVSGSNLLLISDFVFDDHVRNVLPLRGRMRNGDIIFLQTYHLEPFFNIVYPRIKCKFILITHNADRETDPMYAKYLNDDKFVAWLGQNAGFFHPKFLLLPIGFENTYWFPLKIKYIRNVTRKNLIPWKDRKYSIYFNFNANTNMAARGKLMNIYSERFKDAFFTKERVSFTKYMDTIGNSRFVFCPRGNGIDTHRFYETVLMGAIPVVENSTLFSIFERYLLQI